MGINRNRDCGRTILRYNISINDERCLVQDDYGLPAEIYGNLFLNTKEGPAICCHKEGESHHFTENIFHFARSPRDGWQKSSFHKNWYSGGTELPGQDSQAMTDLPFSLEELTEHVPESREACGGYWDRLAALVETKASVN